MLNKIIITKNIKGQYTWSLLAGNGQVIARGLNYASRAACYNGIESVRKYINSEIVESYAE